MFTPNEPDVLSHYLLKVEIGHRENLLYRCGIQNGGFELSPFEAQLFSHLLKYPFCCAAYDAILGVFQPQNQIRKRLYLMLSILETSPAYAEGFLGVHGRWACIRIALVGSAQYSFFLMLGTVLYCYQLSKFHLL